MNAFLHSGDLGDVLSALPLVRHFGGGEVILSPHIGPGQPREPMTEARANFILPVIAAQPYVTAAIYSDKPNRVTHDFSPFRVTTRYIRGEALIGWHARHFAIDPNAIDLAPWLTVTPSPETRGKVVIARSTRYHNPAFRWRRIMNKYLGRTIFVGLPDEHKAFERAHGRPLPYRQVSNALEMAELIAGSDLFIGNQSFPCWLAMAMGHALIQETFPPVPNSLVARPNAKFVVNQFDL